jgi:hypothetical protein
MRRNRPGFIVVAREVVNAGQRAVLPEGLELAQRLVNRTDTPFTDLRFAAELLMGYGDDRQFATLAAALARFKRANEKRHGELWSMVTVGFRVEGFAIAVSPGSEGVYANWARTESTVARRLPSSFGSVQGI